MLNIFEFSRVWENVKTWFFHANKLFWIAQPYFLADIIKNMKKWRKQSFLLSVAILTVIISLCETFLGNEVTRI